MPDQEVFARPYPGFGGILNGSEKGTDKVRLHFSGMIPACSFENTLKTGVQMEFRQRGSSNAGDKRLFRAEHSLKGQQQDFPTDRVGGKSEAIKMLSGGVH